MNNKIFGAKFSIESLTIYRKLLKDDVINKFYTLIKDLDGEYKDLSRFINCYSDFYYTLSEYKPSNSFREYIVECIIYDDNAFSRSCQVCEIESVDETLIQAAKNDLMSLEGMASISSSDIKEAAIEYFSDSEFERSFIKKLPEWRLSYSNNVDADNIFGKLQSGSGWGNYINQLALFHKENGAGDFARYRGFVWERNNNDGRLTGVEAIDDVMFSDLIGYEAERKEVVDNTLILLKGYPANNVLLYGDRGTGKSSTVKALVNEFHSMGLRIIEIPKRYLADLPAVIRLVKDRPQKFILFIDDLAFEDNEDNYTSLKAVLEGGLESRPKNVVIYATSNRRHLVKEKFSDRVGLGSGSHDDEVRSADYMQEKLSLSDRFGLIATFLWPDQSRYLGIIDGLAKNRKLDIDRETLHREALKWVIWNNGRSPRAARQFIDWIEGMGANNR